MPMPLLVRGDHLAQSYYKFLVISNPPKSRHEPRRYEVGYEPGIDPLRAAHVAELCQKYAMPIEGSWRAILAPRESQEASNEV